MGINTSAKPGLLDETETKEQKVEVRNWKQKDRIGRNQEVKSTRWPG